MNRRKVPVLVAPVLLALISQPSFAQDAEEGAGSEEPGTQQAAESKTPADFGEALKQGARAYVAGDFDGAVNAFREALKKDPKSALGHYRLGEALRAKGELEEAHKTFLTGLNFTSEDPNIRAKLLFVIADLHERTKSWEAATKGWTAYQDLAKSDSKAALYPATATERLKRVQEIQDLAAKYAEVKKRIEARVKEAEEAGKEKKKK